MKCSKQQGGLIMLLHQTRINPLPTVITKSNQFWNKQQQGMTVFGLMNVVTITGLLVMVALFFI